MANAGSFSAISDAAKDEIRACFARGLTKAQTVRETGAAYNTVVKYWPRQAAETQNPLPQGRALPLSPPPRLPDPDPRAGGPSLPEPVSQSYETFRIDGTGRWLILCDVHLPFHDKRTIETAVEEAKRKGIVGIVLNGDTIDCYQLSTHSKDPNLAKFRDEVDCARRFLEWLRSQFPVARIIYKEGNHEFRLSRYLQDKAKELADLPGLDLPTLLQFDKYGVEWVADKRVIELGKLNLVHGHEFRGGGGVNPARWLFLRSVSTAMCGHFHRTSEHHESALDRRLYGVWSVGCACYLYPQYDPQNKWNHGFAFVEVLNAKEFHVENRRLLLDGRLV